VKYTGENTMPVSTSTTATCPYCQNTDVRQTTDTGRIQAWSCDRCATDWAFTVQDTCAAVLLTTDRYRYRGSKTPTPWTPTPAI
jgi:transposase-like protein